MPSLQQNQQQSELQTSTNQAVEKAISSLVIALLKNRLPNAMPYVVGFHLLDYDEDENKGLGFIVLKLGKYTGYIPIVFDKGDIKGMEILHIKELNVFPPATDDWIKFFAASSSQLSGQPIAPGSKQTFSIPDITRAALSPLKQAEFKKFANFYKNIQYGEKLLKVARAGCNYLKNKIQKLANLFASISHSKVNRISRPFSFSPNCPSLISELYKQNKLAAYSLVEQIASNPVELFYAQQFYKNSPIWNKLIREYYYHTKQAVSPGVFPGSNSELVVLATPDSEEAPVSPPEEILEESSKKKRKKRKRR